MLKSGSELGTYFSYGLSIKSFIHLPSLVKAKLKKTVDIRQGTVRKSGFYQNFNKNKVIQRSELELTIRASKSTFCIDWFNLGACLIENGSDVIVDINSGVRQREFVPYITGPISAVLLHQLEKLVLHASAVSINNRAILFLGNKGYGKSTLAAHLYLEDYRLVSDDLVPISFLEGVAETVPGYPQIRLFPDSVLSIGLNPQNLPAVNKLIPKRFLKTDENFSINPLKIGGIFILEEDDKTEVKELKSFSAFIEIARHSYLANYLSETENTSKHFQQCRDLVKSVPIFQLKRPHNYNCIQKVSELIKRQISEIVN